MRRHRFSRTVRLPGPPERVWPLLAQTDLLNREMNLPLPEFSFQPRSEGGTDARGEVSLGGIRLRYEEHPFEWVRPAYYSIRRVFHSGPFRVITGRVELAADGDATLATTHVEIDAAAGAGLIARAFANQSLGSFVRVCESFRVHLAEPRMTPYPKESARPPVDAERLQEGIRALMKEGYGAEVEVLREFLTKAPGGEAALFRPSRLKPLERRVALELCLAATRRGLLDLSWRVMCPYCRGNREIVTALSDLREKVHCKSCAIAYDASFDTNVEVLFSVASSVRPVERAAYCIGGPHLAPHVEAQIVVAPGGVEEIGREIPPGCYRLVSLQAPLAVLADAEVGLDVTIDENGLHATPANEWRFRNRLASTATVRVERRDGTPDVVTAAEVTTLAAFRDQFSSEVLAPGVELAVRQVALLFTDLRGSTRMYRERGDAPSYAEVRRHFSLVSQIVADGGGAVVKTIGDAVMAAFHDPADAVRAALEIQRRESNLTTRIGVHAGPAIVVNANDRLDYFGRTVNLAARLQKQSQGRDVVITEALLEDSRVRESLAGVATDSFRAPVPDVEESMRLVRVRPV